MVPQWVMAVLTVIALVVLARVLTAGPNYHTLIAICAVALAVAIILTSRRRDR